MDAPRFVRNGLDLTAQAGYNRSGEGDILMIHSMVSLIGPVALGAALGVVVFRLKGIKRWLCGIGIGILILGLLLMPDYLIEHVFITFPTPEAALDYLASEPQQVVQVLEGETSCLVLTEDGGGVMLLKSGTGYKIPVSGTNEPPKSAEYEGRTLWIMKNRDSSDYYAMFFGPVPMGGIELSDNLGSKFTVFTRPSGSEGDTDYMEAYTRLDGFDENIYVLTVTDASGSYILTLEEYSGEVEAGENTGILRS